MRTWTRSGATLPCGGPHQISQPPLTPSFSKNQSTIAQTRVLAALARIFDLLVQPIILAEILSKSSPVYDSSDLPVRILNGFVYLEYFTTVGDLLYELACLICNLLGGFDACDS